VIYAQPSSITAIGTCDGIDAAQENTYNIIITGLDTNESYDVDLDGDGINDEIGITGVTDFTSTNIPYIDGTAFRNIQVDAGANGVYETTIPVHEVLCTDADNDGDLDFDSGCDLDLLNVDNGYIVSTVAPYVGDNVYVFVLTNSTDNAILANNSGLFTDLPNGDFNVIAINFALASDAATFISGLVFGENGTLVNAGTIPMGCSMNCGSMDYNLDCRVDDVAITKVVTGNADNLNIGDNVTFAIEVFNQGTDPIFDVVVNDYIPAGFDFFVADNTGNAFSNITMDILGGGTATTTLPGPIANQSSQIIQIVLTINDAATNENLTNSAEIIEARQSPGGPLIFDEDSDLVNTEPSLDGENDDDLNDDDMDDAVDEDDFDFAKVMLCIEPALMCSDIILNLNSGECETNVHYNFDVTCLSDVTAVPPSGSIFPIGTTNVAVTLTDNLGVVTTCNFDVIINEFVSTDNSLTCVGLVNLTLDENCQAIISPDKFLVGNNYGCYLDYTIMVLDGSNHDDPPLTLPTDTDGNPIIGGNFAGDTLTVKVIDPVTGNSCWSEVVVEDKFIPELICNNANVNCNEDTSPSALSFPVPATATVVPTIDPFTFNVTNFDPCGAATLTYVDVENSNGDICEGTKTITRTWTITDGSGNSNSCVAIITIVPLTIADILATLPNNITIGCGDPIPDPISNGSIGCDNINLALNGNTTLPGLCDGSIKIVRTYNITDWCTDETVEHIQIIEILDAQPPVAICPADITISNSNNSCLANTTLPQPQITDVCSNTFTTVYTSTVGTINGNLISDLPIGTHTITVEVADDCGNVTDCSFKITVEDAVAPIAVCDEHTSVTLNSLGEAIIDASSFDDESFDNCGIVSYEARRMDNPNCPGNDATSFAATVPFSCCDLGATIMVEFKITDAAGNINTCMVEVVVKDKTPPAIACPIDKDLSCDTDYLSSIVVGQTLPAEAVLANGEAQAIDNCNVIVTNTVIANTIDDCGVGEVTIAWIADDGSNPLSSCTQKYTITNSNPFFINNDNINDPNDGVIWPLDFTATTCGLGLAPDNLPATFDQPIIIEGACDNIAFGHDDTVLNFGADDACLKILRKWFVVDWCQASANQDPTQPGPGAWQYVQIIKVNNTIDPVINAVSLPLVFENLEENCGDLLVAFEITADDDCTAQADLLISWAFSNGVTGTGANASTSLENGSHSLTFTVDDQCGNSSQMTHDFVIEDGKQPTPVCIFGIATTVMPSGGLVMISATDFESGSSYDNCTVYDDLVFSFSEDTSNNTLAINCDEIPDNGLYPITIYVTDEAGNFDFCSTFIDIQDPNGVCPDLSVTINGVVETENQEMVESVTITLSDNNGSLPSVTPVVTGADGVYQFNAAYGDFNVTPEKDINYLNGVTTYDLVLISKHILGLETFDSPYKWIAADANKSNSITALDIVKLRALILHVDDELANNDSWRFVDKDYVFVNPNNPLAEAFPEFVDLDGTTFDPVNFIGVKIGDVNGTVNPNTLLGSETRTFDGELVFEIDNSNVEEGETFKVDFHAKNFNKIEGYQFSINFDHQQLEFVDVMSQLEELEERNFGFTKLNEGVITTSWNQPEPLSLDKNQVVFSLIFKTNNNVQTESLLSINSRYTKAEAYHKNELLNVVLSYKDKMVADKFELFQNVPNPFKAETIIGFNLPKAEKVTLKIMDVTGKLIHIEEVDAKKGYNSVSFKKKGIEGFGVLFYQIETSDETATKKMIIVD